MVNRSRRHRRNGLLLALLGLLAGLCGASIAWACAPGNYGWSEPKAPPAEAAPPSQGVAQPTAPQAPAPAPSHPAPDAGTVNSPNAAPVNSPNAAPVQSPARAPAPSADRTPVAPEPASSPPVEAPSPAPAAPSGGTPESQTPSPAATAGRAPGVGRGSGGSQAGGTVPTPSVSSAGGDLWRGFEADDSASLTPRATGKAVADGPEAGLAVGLAVLGLGVAALLGGLTFALMRRRRVVVRGDADDRRAQA